MGCISLEIGLDNKKCSCMVVIDINIVSNDILCGLSLFIVILEKVL